MARVGITELALRDAHQSLFATRMLTSDMLPIAGELDAAGYWSLESWGGATFDTCIRYLNEDPWERIRKLKAAMPRTPQQMLLRGQNLLGYRHYADDVVDAFVALAAKNGVDVFRIFDALNDVRNLKTAINAVKKTGKHAQAAISYAITPVHTLKLYVELAREMQGMGADSLCIKDMAGLLKPYEAYELVKAIKQVVDIPLDVHSHATTGMSVATLVKSAEAGAELLDTTISSLSMGTSHSPTETMVEIFDKTPFGTGLDIKRLLVIAAYFRDVRRKYKAHESAFLGADTRILVSQVPGGMLSNLESQLREQNALDKIDAVLQENAVVQKDFGYPPLVTPTSQIVGTQAVLNVMFGRYKQLSRESMLLLAGSYGRTPARPNPDLVKKALEGLKMTAAVEARPADTIPNEFSNLEEELKRKTGSSSVTPEDVMTYAMFPQVALSFFKTRANGPVSMEVPAENGKKQTSGSGKYVVVVDGKEHRVARTKTAGGISLVVNGKTHNVVVKPDDGKGAETPAAPAADGKGVKVLAPMPGVIVRLLHEDGVSVVADQSVVIIEALKMQMEVRSTHAGRVRYRVGVGDQVKAGDVLADIL